MNLKDIDEEYGGSVDTSTDADYEDMGPMCCRCYDFVDELFPTNCEEKPELLKDAAIGMYHCPDCGAMLLAGFPHPPLCKLCIERKHPEFDRRADE